MRVQRIMLGQCRPLSYLREIERRYPDAWEWAEQMRLQRGNGIPSWPDWCYLPIAGTNSIVERVSGMPLDALKACAPERLDDSAALAALGPWRWTKGIYRFDSTLYDALIKSKITGDVPHEILYRLPQWCIYVETPGMRLGETVPMHGAFVHLEYGLPMGHPKLQILLDLDRDQGSNLVGLPLPLGHWSLAQSLEMMVGRRDCQGSAPVAPKILSDALHPVVEPILSLLLYVCTQASEISGGASAWTSSAPAGTAGGSLHPPQLDQPMVWDVGVRLGAALRRAVQAGEAESTQGSQGGPRAHVRAAHWHGFRVGPRKRPDGTQVPLHEREVDVRWLPPIAVNLAGTDTLPAEPEPGARRLWH